MPDQMHPVKPETMEPLSENKKVKIYPTFQLDSEDLPELVGWKVGDKYTLVLEVEEMATRQGKEWQGSNEKDNKKVHATFKILKVGVKEENYEEEFARRMSNAPRA